MTKRKLNQAFYLTRELKMWEEELAELIEASQVKAQCLDGMPFQNTGEVSDKVAAIAVKIIERTEMINALKYAIECHINEIMEYITSIDDAEDRQIVYYRCIKMKSWLEIAMVMGGGNTADGIRMRYNRLFDEK